jgi:hypothetical protein
MKTVARWFLLASSVLVAPLAHSSVMKCDTKEPQLFLQWVAIDPTKGTAQIQFGNDTLSGRIAYSRPHDDEGKKYNLVFPSPHSFHDESAIMELILFPMGDGQWRVGGVITELLEGQRHIDVLAPSAYLTCSTLNL